MLGILRLRAWIFPLFTTDMRLCYLTAFYLVSAGIAPADSRGLVPMVRLLLSIGLYEAWGVLVNDWVDRDLDTVAGKRTGLDITPGWQVKALFVLLPIMGFALIPEPGSNPMVVGIMVACYIMALTYSAPAGRRLKEKGAWGFVADVILEKPLPSLMLFAYFHGLGIDALILAAFYSRIGAFTLALHQIGDYETDKLHGVRTLAVAMGKQGLQRIYRLAFVPFFLISGGLSLLIIVLETGSIGQLAALGFTLSGLALGYLSWRGIVLRNDPNRPGVTPEMWFVYIFFDGPMPTLLGIAVVIGAPVYLPVFLALLISQIYMFAAHYRWALMKIAMALRR